MIRIRAATLIDAVAMRDLFDEAARGGDVLPSEGPTELDDFIGEWFDAAILPFVAVDGERVTGQYKLGANHGGRGSHVATATFVVGAADRGGGVGTALVEHCLATSVNLDFAAIQFNYVVGTNAAALALYAKFGFEVVGRLPGAFRHATFGLVDALVLYKRLANGLP